MTDAREKAIERLAAMLSRLTWDYEAIDAFEVLTGDEATAAEMRRARRDGNYVTSERRVAGALLSAIGPIAIDPALVERYAKANEGWEQPWPEGAGPGGPYAESVHAALAAAAISLADAVLAQLRAKP
jgi:hypothetical protein